MKIKRVSTKKSDSPNTASICTNCKRNVASYDSMLRSSILELGLYPVSAVGINTYNILDSLDPVVANHARVINQEEVLGAGDVEDYTTNGCLLGSRRLYMKFISKNVENLYPRSLPIVL